MADRHLQKDKAEKRNGGNCEVSENKPTLAPSQIGALSPLASGAADVFTIRATGFKRLAPEIAHHILALRENSKR